MSAPLHPLPDLPRISPPSDLARLALRVLEWRDMEALTRLPDMLMDIGRADDATHIRDMLGEAMWTCSESNPENGQAITNGSAPYFSDVWFRFANELAKCLWWDIFDWQATLGTMGTALATYDAPDPDKDPPMEGPSLNRGSHGTVSVDGAVIGTIASWAIEPQFASATAGAEHELHASESHPDYEYRRTRHIPELLEVRATGWERNLPSERRYEVPGDSLCCWRRRKPL